jgi:hypothetical protein
MTSELLIMFFVAWLMERTSHPIRSGAYTIRTSIAVRNAENFRTDATVLNACGKNKYLSKCPDAEVRAVLSFSHPTIPNLKHVRI